MKQHKNNHGFTIIEVLIALTLAAVLSIVSIEFFSSSFNNYIKLSKDSTNLSEVAGQTQRIARVLRGLTDISDASSTNELSVYAYFSPVDTYVSLIRYYKNSEGTVVYADVTPMTANPPNGSLITANKKTYTIISNFYSVSNVNLFTYLNAAGDDLTTPITDQYTIKGIRISLAVPTVVGKNTSSSSYTTTTLQVSLRNRKTNL
ncbi:prepilin-type N-terminal cleavage/methylation domain-containing protein [bacterium]|nr:prepilin-type N-terminal cleavage/methylation domain-containing protein [bacterium]NBX97668.1 prepilin-type N-terminal cleavage/methylation domain-containing protein [bacterium]NDC94141.1 prepilin-type N-terminal cleavage/methylation domain-containing protein [bacterium]NDD83138.1 prepilin-type N-terminal cleavage/methylation domain-containing protein [bacterium]NDG29361.1 prepilin-type N-terminal cleavage/methylation domain-containing protein [bacterium]